MACGLSDDGLFILYVLYSGKCLAKNRGYHSKKLEHLYIKKFSSDFENSIKNLLKKGYIAPIKKQELKYYISDIKIMSIALGSHGYVVTKGRVRPLL
jgi:hypothetical protein